MGKSNRNKQANKEARQLAAEQKKQAQAAAQKKEKRNKVISIVSVVLAVVLVGSLLVYNSLSASGFFMRQNIAAHTETLQLTQVQASYFYNQLYSRYYSMASYFGIDTTKSLKDQPCSITGTGSWFDYFMSTAKSDMSTVLQFAEEAKTLGMELDETDKKEINDAMKTLRANARAAGVSKSYYIRSVYGIGVNESDIREILELTALYQKCYNSLVDSYNFTADDYKNYRTEHEQDLQTIDYVTMSLTADDAPVAGEITNEMLADYAKRFQGAKNLDAFNEIAREYLTEHAYKGDSSIDADYIEEEIASFLTENASYVEDSEFFTWAFDKSRKANDTYTYANEDGSAQYVYLLISPASVDESSTVNVRHILLTSDTYGSAEEAKAKADELLAQWKSGAATAESFAELAKEYSEDGSATEGGLLENAAPGDMVENFDAWLFADGRQIGDSGVVESEYGYHVMYLDSFGLKVWEAEADLALKNAQLTEDNARIALAHPITFDEAVLSAVNG